MAISVEIKNIEPMSVGADGAKLIQGPPGPRGERGERGETGADGVGIASAELISGTHAAGTSDTYRITYTDGKSFDFPVYNGADGKDGWDGEGAVRYDEAQGLDDSQKIQACDNISALKGKTVYYWNNESSHANDLFAILTYGGTGVVADGASSGSVSAPTGMTFPAFIVCGGVTYGKRDFSVFDAGGAIWEGTGNLMKGTLEGINRVDLALGLSSASAGMVPSVGSVGSNGKPASWTLLGVVTPENLTSPGSPADLVNYAAFQAAVPLVQQMNITGAAVGQIAKIASVDGNGAPTQWAAADMPADLPDVTADDNGKFLRVVNGAWAADVSSAVTGFAKIASGTYTGTGTYGADNPCSLTFDFEPKIVIMLGYLEPNVGWQPLFGGSTGSSQALSTVMTADALSTTYSARTGFLKGNSYSTFNTIKGKKSEDGKTFYWYDTESDSGQCNSEGYTYYYLAIG